MTLTPAIKGQLTKILNSSLSPRETLARMRNMFAKHMPREQAKHAAKKYRTGFAS